MAEITKRLPLRAQFLKISNWNPQTKELLLSVSDSAEIRTQLNIAKLLAEEPAFSPFVTDSALFSSSVHLNAITAEDPNNPGIGALLGESYCYYPSAHPFGSIKVQTRKFFEKGRSEVEHLLFDTTGTLYAKVHTLGVNLQNTSGKSFNNLINAIPKESELQSPENYSHAPAGQLGHIPENQPLISPHFQKKFFERYSAVLFHGSALIYPLLYKTHRYLRSFTFHVNACSLTNICIQFATLIAPRLLEELKTSSKEMGWGDFPLRLFTASGTIRLLKFVELSKEIDIIVRKFAIEKKEDVPTFSSAKPGQFCSDWGCNGLRIQMELWQSGHLCTLHEFCAAPYLSQAHSHSLSSKL